MVLQQIRILLLNILSLFRRLCCFYKRRKVSMQNGISQEPEMVVVVSGSGSGSGRRRNEGNERDWNSWDDRPRTVEEHIEKYRERIAAPPTQEEPEPDFFSELTPVINPQPKYYLPTNENTKERNTFSRLTVTSDVPINMHADLEDWEEENKDGSTTGWEQLDSAQAKEIIREKRRQSRNQRQSSAMKSGAVNSSPNAVRLSNEQRHNNDT